MQSRGWQEMNRYIMSELARGLEAMRHSDQVRDSK
jgi:hypothetical protein